MIFVFVTLKPVTSHCYYYCCCYCYLLLFLFIQVSSELQFRSQYSLGERLTNGIGMRNTPDLMLLGLVLVFTFSRGLNEKHAFFIYVLYLI